MNVIKPFLFAWPSLPAARPLSPSNTGCDLGHGSGNQLVYVPPSRRRRLGRHYIRSGQHSTGPGLSLSDRQHIGGDRADIPLHRQTRSVGQADAISLFQRLREPVRDLRRGHRRPPGITRQTSFGHPHAGDVQRRGVVTIPAARKSSATESSSLGPGRRFGRCARSQLAVTTPFKATAGR